MYPNAFYRVSVKALIRDPLGRVLVCKEWSDNWSLPGGGIEHGEEPLAALERELKEELGISLPFTDKPSSVFTVHHEEKDTWLMWIVYEINLETPDELIVTYGEGISEHAFLHPKTFARSTTRASKLIRQALKKL